MENEETVKAISKHVYYEDVEILNGQYGYYKEGKNGKVYKPCGGAVYVTAMNTNIDTFEQTVALGYQNAQGFDVKKTLSREELTDIKLLNMAKYGAQVQKRTIDIFQKSLENQMFDCPSKLTHNILGFGNYNNSEIFKGYKGINVDSTYNGERNITPKGSYDVWKQMIDEQVMGNTALEFIIASAVAGLLVDYLKKSIPIENLIIHCIGESSSGKSTSALLAVSTGSAPDLAGDSFAFNFQDTQNSLMRSIPCSYPTLIDEGSLLDSKDLTNMMYSISSGVEKKRLSKDLKVQDNVKFNTVIYLTSEKSLLKQCKQNSGLLVRHIEFQGVQWTTSAEHSDSIKSTISENHGHLLPMVAEVIMNLGKEKIVKALKVNADKVVSTTKKRNIYNEFTERISKQLALIVVSAYILKKQFEFDINVNEMVDFMLKATTQNQETMGDRALSWISSWITKNHSNLIVAGNTEIMGTCKGKIESINQVSIEDNVIAKKQLLIDKECFVEMMAEGGFDNPDIVLKEFRTRGYLEAPKDRFVSNINIVSETKTKGYKIYLPISKEESNSSTENIVQETKEKISEYRPTRRTRRMQSGEPREGQVIDRRSYRRETNKQSGEGAHGFVEEDIEFDDE